MRLRELRRIVTSRQKDGKGRKLEEFAKTDRASVGNGLIRIHRGRTSPERCFDTKVAMLAVNEVNEMSV